MFKILTKNRKGFTLVELVAVIGLLGLGAVALINLFNVGWRSFNKSEERYVKQEAVKKVATMLQNGSAGVSAASAADIFATADVVPAGSKVDESFSYLYAKEHKTDGKVDGYLVSILDAGDTADKAEQLSDVPIYIGISAYQQRDNNGNLLTRTVEVNGTEKNVPKNYPAVTVTLAALEDDYDYESGNPPTSDEIFYSLDVTYHFPNMAESDTGVTVNAISDTILSSANTYTTNGGKDSTVYAENEGVALRVYCDSIISGDETNSIITLPSLCFIATASYGNDSGEVGMLCHFRDSVLKQSALGRAFIKAYYAISPPIAEFISQSEPLKAAVRFALKPMVMLATFATDSDLATDNIGWLALLGISALGIGTVTVTYGVRKHKAKKANSGQG